MSIVREQLLPKNKNGTNGKFSIAPEISLYVISRQRSSAKIGY